MGNVWEVVWLSLIGITMCCGGFVGLLYATSDIQDDELAGQWHQRTQSEKINFYIVATGRSVVWVPIGMVLGALYGIFWPVTLIGACAALVLCTAYQRMYGQPRAPVEP